MSAPEVYWEYWVCEIVDQSVEQEQKILSDAGKNGWKLISVIHTGSVRRRFYFQRMNLDLFTRKLPPKKKAKR
jgi:Domain of unknown function (DUF4177)